MRSYLGDEGTEEKCETKSVSWLLVVPISDGEQLYLAKRGDLSADEQVQSVSKKLQELNPRFDGHVTPTIDDGVVSGLQLITDDVTDISPVRALSRLSVLDLIGSSAGKGRLVNLSPLKGLPITRLAIYHNQVSDLSPLQGMKLTYLNSSGTFVSDLSALKGMPLKVLYLTGQPVFDLSPLTDMPLYQVVLNLTYVSDLSPLKGMPLSELQCEFDREGWGIDLSSL